MDLWNAKLQRIDRPGTPDGRGQITHIEGASIDVRCVIGEPSMAQAMTLGARLKDLAAVLYVTLTALPSGTSIAPGDRLLVQPWDRAADSAFGAATLYEVIETRPLAGDHLSHYQVLLRGTGGAA